MAVSPLDCKTNYLVRLQQFGHHQVSCKLCLTGAPCGVGTRMWNEVGTAGTLVKRNHTRLRKVE